MAAPTTVLFDASGTVDVDGDIARYIFDVGHRTAPLVVEVPRIQLNFPNAYRIGGIYRPMPVTVTVVDSTGLEATVTTQFWIVDTEAECADVGVHEPDLVIQDVVEEDQQDQQGSQDLADDVPVPDWNQELTVKDVVDVTPETIADVHPMDVGDVALPDLGPGDIAGDGPETCPTLGSLYTVKIRCDGSVEAVLDLELSQLGCNISDKYDVVSGSLVGHELTMESSFTELKIEHCVGPVQNVALFTLECTNGCSAEYALKP